MRPSFDLVTCVGAKDVAKFKVFLPLIKRNIRPNRIFVIAHKNLKAQLAYAGTSFIDEDLAIPGLTYDRLREWIRAINPGAAERTGWYFQQFLKMGACRISALEDYYLIWDSDLAPFRPLTFFDNDGTVLLAPGTHQHSAYFTTLRNLLPEIPPPGPVSLVSEHLMVKTAIMNELIEKIAMEPNGNWVMNCLRAIRPEDLPYSGFSEYETYGHYMAANYPASFRVRELKYLRSGGTCAKEPGRWFLIACSAFFDIGAFERWSPSLSSRVTARIRQTALRVAPFVRYNLRSARSQSD